MKKLLSILFSVFTITMNCKAQDATTSQVTPGASYITTNLVTVNPVTDSDPDHNISFRLKRGTKFYISKVIPGDNGAIKGYAIRMWNFKSDPAKKDFYDKIIKSGDSSRKAALASIKKLNEAKAELDQASDNLKKAQDAVDKAKAGQLTILDQVYVKSLTLKPKKDIPALNKDRKAATFFSDQAKISNIAPEFVPDSVKKSLVAKSMALTTKNNEFKQLQNSYIRAQADVKAAKTALEQAKSVKATKESAVTHLSVLTYMINTRPQSQDAGEEKLISYKITKPQVGQNLDDILHDLNPAALYDTLAYVDSWANGWQFFISSADFNANCTSIFPRTDKFTWGFLNLPIKLRPDNARGGRFNFEQNLNFGLTAGWKHQYVSTSDISFNALGGVSIVNVPLTTTTDADGKVTQNSAAAVSFSVGGMLQYDKFQVGLFTGWDFAGSNAKDFAYQGKRWFGLAIGVSLFGEGKTTNQQQTQGN